MAPQPQGDAQGDTHVMGGRELLPGKLGGAPLRRSTKPAQRRLQQVEVPAGLAAGGGDCGLGSTWANTASL